MYVPTKLIVDGNPTATAANITSHETLFRAGIACNLLSELLFLWVALALYDLFKTTNRRHAVAMVALVFVSVPIAMLNELNAFAALMLTRGHQLSLHPRPTPPQHPRPSSSSTSTTRATSSPASSGASGSSPSACSSTAPASSPASSASCSCSTA